MCPIYGMQQNRCYINELFSIKGTYPFQVSGYSSSVFEDVCYVELPTTYRRVFAYMSCSANGVVKGFGLTKEELRCAHMANETFQWKIHRELIFSVPRTSISSCKNQERNKI